MLNRKRHSLRLRFCMRPRHNKRMTLSRSYLTRFRPKHTPHFFTDVLVIGAGIAGVRAALAVPPELRVLIVTKDVIQQSNSAYAQGGIATVLSAEDRF
jgi:L-aspartate oxidase